MIDEIYSHFEREYPKEGCGVITDTDKFIPCKNIATTLDDFQFCPEEYLSLLLKYKIKAIVHNHINASNEPSDHDLNNCKVLNIPYYIFSYPEMALNIVKPEDI